jgi:succinoglycan biosynthesis transport protein ExoP
MTVAQEELSTEEESQLHHAWRVIRDRWWVIALAVVACVGVSLVLALSSDDEYEATSRLLFRDPGLSTAVTGTSVFTPSTDPQRDAATNVELVRSTEVARRVVEDLGLNETPEQLLDSVTISAEENADIVEITARDTNPELAAAIANSFAEQYVRFRQQSDRAKVREGERLLTNRIESTSPDSAERLELEAALRQLVLLESVQTGNAEVTDQAEVPSSPVSPRPARDAILGVIFGLVLGCGLALLLDLLDRRVKSVEEFERRYGVTTLATIPQRAFEASTADQRLAAAEPYRILRSAIDYRSSWSPIRNLLVTSAAPGEGKTTVAVNLARAAAVGGQSVILVEADLRRPSFSQHFDIGNAVRGLSTALARDVPPKRMLHSAETETLRVLPSGMPPPNPSELIRSSRMEVVLGQLDEIADLVIIDSSPLLPVADAQSLLGRGQVDACLVVARAYRTTRQDIRRARSILQQHGVTPIGLVVCGTPGGVDHYARYQPLGKPDLAHVSGDHDVGPLMPQAPVGARPRTGRKS